MTDEIDPKRQLRAAGKVIAMLDKQVAELEAEIERLRRWKDEAISVIDDWQAVWESVGRPGALGQSKSLAMLAELGRLGDEIERLEFERDQHRDAASAYKAETERLRAAGDKLARLYQLALIEGFGYKESAAIDEWQETRGD